MALRTSATGAGYPGGRVEYHGDIPPFSTTYADPKRDTAVGRRLVVPAEPATHDSPVVSRKDDRAGYHGFLVHGGMRMPVPVPGRPGYGQVYSSNFQRVEVDREQYEIITSWHGAGYPRNLGWSFHVAEIEKQPSGQGQSSMVQAPFFDGVQTVPRVRAHVKRYPTLGR